MLLKEAGALECGGARDIYHSARLVVASTPKRATLWLLTHLILAHPDTSFMGLSMIGPGGACVKLHREVSLRALGLNDCRILELLPVAIRFALSQRYYGSRRSS